MSRGTISAPIFQWLLLDVGGSQLLDLGSVSQLGPGSAEFFTPVMHLPSDISGMAPERNHERSPFLLLTAVR